MDLKFSADVMFSLDPNDVGHYLRLSVNDAVISTWKLNNSDKINIFVGYPDNPKARVGNQDLFDIYEDGLSEIVANKLSDVIDSTRIPLDNFPRYQ